MWRPPAQLVIGVTDDLIIFFAAAGTLNADEFRSVTVLRYLDLSRNDIARLPADLSVHLSHLDTLNLSANALTQLSAAVFSRAHRLSVLDVSNNRIQVRQPDKNS